MSKYSNAEWELPDNIQNWEQAGVSVMMDIRRELREINASLSVLKYPRFMDIPRKLDKIVNNTKKPARKI